MKRVILTTAMIVLTLMSCTPEEQVRTSEPIEETTETTTEESTTESTEEPVLEPIPFIGEWVVWGNYAPHCNCYQRPNEISEEPSVVINQGDTPESKTGTLLIDGASFNWTATDRMLETGCKHTVVDIDREGWLDDSEYFVHRENAVLCNIGDVLTDTEHLKVYPIDRDHTGGGFIDGVYSKGYFILVRR